ncbi:MAG: DUF1540 domain-containing protein [Clostridia bacterium]|nr:DUF1540 domain-containing protein [Clostridia bacterium]
MPGIHCGVEECVHNEAKRCLAETIRVRSRAETGARCRHSDDTCCESFKPREENR